MRIEVEKKYRVDDIERWIHKLAALGAPPGPIKQQSDRIFLPEGKGFDDLPAGVPVLRIRATADGCSTTAKKYVRDATEREEVEVDIGDATDFADYLKLIGFHEVVVVNKQRRRATLDEVVILLDTVEGLGSFIELEVMSNTADVAAAHAKIDLVAAKLGLDSRAVVSMPYDVQLYEAQRGR